MHWKSPFMLLVLHVSRATGHLPTVFMNMKGKFSTFVFFHNDLRNPYCQECYSKCIAPKCVSCGEPILSIYTAALGGYWHPQCFICHEPGCGPFKNAKFFELNGKPYCETHYLQRIGMSSNTEKSSLKLVMTYHI